MPVPFTISRPSVPVRRLAVALLLLGSLAPGAALAAAPHVRLCTKTIHVPAVTRTVHERVATPSRTVDTIVPPRFSTTTRHLVTQSPRTRIQVHAPRIDRTTIHVREPDRIVERHIPARTRKVRRKVLIAPARTVHRPCMRHGRHASCAVHLPAKYGVRVDTVVTHPARTVHARVKGRTTARERRTVVAPGAVERIHEGPRYRTLHVATPEVPTHPRRAHVPGRHVTVAREVVVTPAHTRTVRVPCGH